MENRPVLEGAAATPVAVIFVRRRVRQVALLVAERRPFVADRAQDAMRASAGRKVDARVLEVVIAADTVWGGCLVGGRIPERTLFPALRGPCVANWPEDVVCTGALR